jgi:hypothetical protein
MFRYKSFMESRIHGGEGERRRRKGLGARARSETVPNSAAHIPPNTTACSMATRLAVSKRDVLSAGSREPADSGVKLRNVCFGSR